MELEQNGVFEQLLNRLEKEIGKRPGGLDSLLFLIGVQELGKGPKKFSKEQKQDLLHIAVCRLLSLDGYFVEVGRDEEGWPHFRKTQKEIPIWNNETRKQELEALSIRYFNQIWNEDYKL